MARKAHHFGIIALGIMLIVSSCMTRQAAIGPDDEIYLDEDAEVETPPAPHSSALELSADDIALTPDDWLGVVALPSVLPLEEQEEGEVAKPLVVLEAKREPPSTPKPSPAPKKSTRLVIAPQLNIRSRPDRFSEPVGLLDRGAVVEVIEDLPNGWTKIGKGRYVRSKHLRAQLTK